ncbi:auxin transporter-like protein 1 isoform X2 [Asparagus officinalis]|uniref:auxin transporter-like protein 1 isoform X2 n=1 Tax=Asparagus officinalis TaxID=4686 RepID=UPI00098E644F|nr:auxin transporter-like protein 1 isoform X2 [Asparagus officinalis]
MTLEEQEKAEAQNGVGPASAEAAGDDTAAGRDMFNKLVWHGGSVADAWLNAASAQVGSLILTLPYTFAQMGYAAGVGLQFVYGAFGCWTVYLLSLFHTEASRRTREAGTLHKRHVLQIKNVQHQGPNNLLDFFTGATNILFSFGSHGLCIELMEAMWKPQRYKWAYAAAVLYTYILTIPDSVAVYWAYGDILLHRSNAFGVLPQSTFKNACIISMILHQYVSFLLNVNPLFLAWEKLVGVHYSSRFIFKAIARVPVVLVIWFLALAIPFFGPINSVMGAFLIAFSVYIIPCVAFVNAYRNKQLQALQGNNGKWRLWISVFVGTWVAVFGFGFGGWASGTTFFKQIKTFGFFMKCYQCPPKNQLDTEL